MAGISAFLGLFCLAGSVVICQESTIPFLRSTNREVRLSYINFLWVLPLSGLRAIQRAGESDRSVLIKAIAQCLLFVSAVLLGLLTGKLKGDW